MIKTYRNILIAWALVCSVMATAQNQTSSPFSRYAYGDLNDNVPIAYRAMGGLGIGMRNNKVICSAQPASYTACDSLTFMFDIAASAMWSRYSDASGMRNKANGNLEYIALQFPIYKRYIAFSAGVLPYSSVGYDIAISDSINSDYHYTKSYLGEGGISQVYAGLGFNICDWVALGANVYYMFGDVQRARTLTFTESGLHSTLQDEILSVSSVRLRYGLQLFHTFDEHSFTVGGIFENKMKLNSEYYAVETSTDDSVFTSKGGFETPMMYGAGLSYTWANRLTVGLDFQRQCMASALYYYDTGAASGLQDRNKYAFGVEYRHNPQGRRYVDRVMWRCGLSVADEYLRTIQAKAYTASIGVGFPLRNAGTILNTTLEYQHRGNQAAGLVDNSLRLTINASIAENWFFKRKL
ncbi:MAG: hypothetical protein IK073_07360 [Paludibacteraceae bacterium]|nr:hypothetical protein [Paludibacteraceae bacterium]